MKPEVKEIEKTETTPPTLEEQLAKANEAIASMLTMDQAIRLVPEMFGERLLGALTRKYGQKFDKLPAEQASHREQFPAFAANTAMLYILAAAKQEAEEKLASEDRIVNVANLTSMVNAYVQADTLTEFQTASNKQRDLEIENLRDKVASTQEQRNLLKAVRNTYIKSIDYAYVKAQDNKLRRACHIFGTSIEAIAK